MRKNHDIATLECALQQAKEIIFGSREKNYLRL